MTIHAAWPLLPFLSVWPPRTPPPICLLTGAGLSQADCLKAGCSAPAYKLLEKVVTSGGRHLGLPISLPSRFQLWPWKPGAPITQRTDIAAGELGEESETHSQGVLLQETVRVPETARVETDLGEGQAF